MDKSLVYLAQTDTTVGFLSGCYRQLNILKNRKETKKVLQEVDSCKTLQKYVRVPKRFRPNIRRAKKTTFIYPNQKAFRVVDSSSLHHSFLSRFSILYSTSANRSNEKFDERFAKDSADVIVYTQNGFYENSGSHIYKITKNKIKKVR